MPRTFADLIYTVSTNVGDLYDGTVTGVVNTTTFSDTSLGEGDGWWIGGNLAFTSGENLGIERRIVNWTQAGSTFTTGAFPTAPTIGDTYVIRRRPKHTQRAVMEFINQGVREIERQSWVTLDTGTSGVAGGSTGGILVEEGLEGLFTVTQGFGAPGLPLVYHYGVQEYLVPDSFEFVHRVLYKDIGDPYGNTPWIELDQDKWTTNAIGSILIQPLDDFVSWDTSSITLPDGAPLRYVGSRRPQPFNAFADENPYEGNYLEVFATARLCLRLGEGAQDEADFGAKFKMFYSLEADAFRGTRRALPSGSRKVR